MLFSRSAPKLHVAIDVGSNSIKGILFESSSPGAFRIVKKISYQLPSTATVHKIVEKLHEFIFALVRSLGKIPASIVIGLGPNVGEYSITNWAFRHQGHSLSQKDLQYIFDSQLASHRVSGTMMLAFPLETLANGYSVSGMELAKEDLSAIREFSFHVLVQNVPPELGAELLNVKKSLGGMPITFVPNAIAFAGLLAEQGLRDFFLIDVGGDGTALALVRNGVLVDLKSFPIGGRHFIKGIAKIASVSLEEAETMRRQYADGLLPQGQRARVKEFLQAEAETWKKGFLETLDLFYQSGAIPPNVLLSGGGANIPEIAEVVRTSDWIQDFSYVDSVQPKIVTAESLLSGSTAGGYLRGPENACLAALATYSFKNSTML